MCFHLSVPHAVRVEDSKSKPGITPSKMAPVEALLNCIRENLVTAWTQSLLTEVLRGAAQSLQADSKIMPLIRL